jgi:hypothetical protein
MSSPESGSSSKASYTHKATYTGNITMPTALPTESIYNSGAGSIESTMASAAGLLLVGCMLLL